MFRWKSVVVATAVVSVGLAGCAGKSNGSSGISSSGGSGSSGGTLTLGGVLQPVSFAANGANWANESIYEQAVYDTLVRAKAEDNTPIPGLATSWSYNAAKTVLTMKMRSGVTFTDGTKFDASVAAQNLIRFRNGTASQKANLVNLKSAKAVDASTLVLTLSQPDPALLPNLSQAAGLMESPKAFSSSTLKTVPVGSGPYVMDPKNTVVGSKYVFTKNPNYWAKSEQHWDKLVITVLSTPQTQLNAIRGGQVDGTNVIDPSTLSQIKGAGFTLYQHDLDWAGIALLDRGGKQTKALGDVRVRQAINYAVDRAAILKASVKGAGTVTSSVFPTYSPGYDKALDTYYTYDPAKAKALLKAAGYSSFTLNMPQVAGFGDVANNLIKQYLGDVGIKVTFTTVAGANIISDVLAPKYSAAYFTLQEDPVAFQESKFLFTPDATFNPYKYTDPKVVAWVKTIQTGSDAAAKAATTALNRYTVEQAWNAPFYRQTGTFAASSKITAKAQAGNAFPYLYNITPKG